MFTDQSVYCCDSRRNLLLKEVKQYLIYLQSIELKINTIGIEEEISITDGHAEVESVTNAYTFLILMHTFLFIKYQKRHFRTKRNESSIRK